MSNEQIIITPQQFFNHINSAVKVIEGLRITPRKTIISAATISGTAMLMIMRLMDADKGDYTFIPLDKLTEANIEFFDDIVIVEPLLSDTVFMNKVIAGLSGGINVHLTVTYTGVKALELRGLTTYNVLYPFRGGNVVFPWDIKQEALLIIPNNIHTPLSNETVMLILSTFQDQLPDGVVSTHIDIGDLSVNSFNEFLVKYSFNLPNPTIYGDGNSIPFSVASNIKHRYCLASKMRTGNLPELGYSTEFINEDGIVS